MNIQSAIKLTLAALVVVSLVGCAASNPPPLNFSVQNVGMTSQKINAEVKAITVTYGQSANSNAISIGDMTFGTNPFVESTDRDSVADELTNAIPIQWQMALTEALDDMTIFQDDAPTKVSISVKIRGIGFSGMGPTATVKAGYRIIDRKTGDIIYDQDITSNATIPYRYALYVVRTHEAMNQAVQNNIAQFLQALESVDITKPMFPADTVAK